MSAKDDLPLERAAIAQCLLIAYRRGLTLQQSPISQPEEVEAAALAQQSPKLNIVARRQSPAPCAPVTISLQSALCPTGSPPMKL